MPPKAFIDKAIDNVKLRLYCFQHFLQVLVGTKQIAYSQELLIFLKGDEKQFEEIKKESASLRRMIEIPTKFISAGKGKSRPITEIKTFDGVAELQMDPKIRKMGRELTKLMNTVAPLEARAANIGKEITMHYTKIKENLEDLEIITGKITQAYSDVAEKFELERMSKVGEIYRSLSTTFSKWKQVATWECENFFQNIRILFAFSSQEEQGLQEVRTWKEANSCS